MLGRVVLSLSDGLGEHLLKGCARTATLLPLESVTRYMYFESPGLGLRVALLCRVADLKLD